MPPRYETVHVTVDDAAIDAGDVGTIIEPVWWRADIYNGPDEYERSLAPFSDEQRMVFSLRWYISEVNNGGHRQFYSNSTGIVWKDAYSAFKAISVLKGADIILTSADRLGGNPSLDRDIRGEQFAEYDPDFNDLDKDFYGLQTDNCCPIRRRGRVSRRGQVCHLFLSAESAVQPEINFGDSVRVRTTEETKAAGVAGFSGQVSGETKPSVTRAEIVGAPEHDYAIAVHFDDLEQSFWFAPDLLEFIDHAPGTEIQLDGVDKKWTRTSDGQWIEESTASRKRPWWRLW